MMDTIDSFFDVDILADLSDAVVTTADKLSATLANAVAKVAGNTLGGLWWVVSPNPPARIPHSEYSTRNCNHASMAA